MLVAPLNRDEVTLFDCAKSELTKKKKAPQGCFPEKMRCNL